MKKNIKITKYFLLFILLLTIFISNKNISYANNSSKKVILGGNTIGLKLDTGVFIAGKYQVEVHNKKVSPWKNSNIKEGDKILEYNGHHVSTNNDILEMLRNDHNEMATLKVERNGKIFSTTIDIVKTKNMSKSLGLYIKDRMIGIGTLTFIDDETNIFASLGHGIYENSVVIGAQNGNITTSSVESIKKSLPGEAGEKRASISNVILGSIYANKTTGVYGKISNIGMFDNKKIETAKQEDVKIGKAKILTVIEGNKIEAFDIKITSIALQHSIDVKGLKIEITDGRLLNVSGGIVQGMSGSPIIQDDKLVGAVSHVCLDNPKNGYGMHIEWMLKDALV